MIDIIIAVISITLSYYYAAFVHDYDRSKVWMGILVFIAAFLIIYILICAIFWLLCCILSLTIDVKKEYTSYSRFYGIVFGLIMEYGAYLAGARVRVIGKDKLPKRRFLLVSNHLSGFDPLITAGELKSQRLAFISKGGNFGIPIGRRYMKRCRYMTLDREDIRSGAQVIRKAADMVSSGDCSVGVYPEGTRNHDGGGLLEFKPGCFKIALWAKCPIVVEIVRGTQNIHKRFPLRHTKVTVEFAEVIEYDDIKDKNTTEIAQLVKEIMLDRMACAAGGNK
ncbi:MAG: 1-acyl-sn-glycerol-3-phosphate acyltransferase [Butyrivibrio sp.]|nr:1-acyl-sn-glycerol-3-phosphate acyltransferase [Butyrivibrio sp.]